MVENPEKDNSYLRKGLKKLFAKHDKNQSSQGSKKKNSNVDNVTKPKQQQKNVKLKNLENNSQETCKLTSENLLNENKSKSKLKNLLTNKNSTAKLSNNLNSKEQVESTILDGKKISNGKNQNKVPLPKVKENTLLNKNYWEKLKKTTKKDLTFNLKENSVNPKSEAPISNPKGPISTSKLKKNKINVKRKKISKKSDRVLEESKLKADSDLTKDHSKKKQNAGDAVPNNVSKKRKLKKRKLHKENAILLEGKFARKPVKNRKRKRTKSYSPNLEEIKKPKCTEVSLLPPSTDDSEFDSSSSWVPNSTEDDASSVLHTDSDSNISSFYTSDDDISDLSFNSESSEYCTHSSSDSLTFLDEDSLNDPDYQPPDDIQIIKKGMAISRVLKEDEVQFGEADEIQIVELTEAVNVKSIIQPKSCHINELKKLNIQNVETEALINNNISITSVEMNIDDDCPDLVPICNDSSFESSLGGISYKSKADKCSISSTGTNSKSYDIEETEEEEYEVENECKESYEHEHMSEEYSGDENTFKKDSEDEDTYKQDSEGEECFEEDEIYDEDCEFEDMYEIETDDGSGISCESVEQEDDCSDDSMSSIDILTKYVKTTIKRNKPGKVNVDIIDGSNCNIINFPCNNDSESEDVVEIKHSFSNNISRREVENCKIVFIPIVSELELRDETTDSENELQGTPDIVSLYENKSFNENAKSSVKISVKANNSKNLSARNSRLVNTTRKEVAEIVEPNSDTSSSIDNDMVSVDSEQNSDAADAESNDSRDITEDRLEAGTTCTIGNDSRELVNMDSEDLEENSDAADAESNDSTDVTDDCLEVRTNSTTSQDSSKLVNMDSIDLEQNSDTTNSQGNDSTDVTVGRLKSVTSCTIGNDSRELVNMDSEDLEENSDAADAESNDSTDLTDDCLEVRTNSTASQDSSKLVNMDSIDLKQNSDTTDCQGNDNTNVTVDRLKSVTSCITGTDSKELVNLDLNTDTKHISIDVFASNNHLDSTAYAEDSIVEPQHLNSVFYHSFITNQVLVHLKEPISIYGTVILTSVIGSVSVYGHTPQNGKEFPIFSPRGCSTVEIIPTTVKNVDVVLELNKLKGTFISRDLKTIEEEFIQKKDAIVLLKCNERSKKVVQIFKDCMKENVFPKYKQIYIQGSTCESNTLLECIINKNNEKAFKIQPEWSTLPLKAETKIMIVGGKSVGKSTLVRYMINNHLNTHKRILLIDLDIGQSEMFLPQTVSCFVIDEPLLGPGFFQNKQPAKAYFVGHSSILICSHRYLSAAKQLIEYCHNNEKYSKLPWVINTMGYNKGCGLELLALLCQYLKPTDVVQIQSNKEINNFNEILKPDIMAGALRKPYIGVEFILNESYIPMYSLHILNTAVAQDSRYQKAWDMSAKDLRYAMILSRLSVVLSESGEGLTSTPPLKAKLADVKILKPFVNGVDPQTLLKSIDTNLVYLCRAEDVLPPECYGIGIVTGVDYTLNLIYLLPALPYENMENVNCMALSDVPIPTALLKQQSKYSEHAAPLLYSAVDTKTFKSVKQIYHRSAEFLTGNRNSLL
ncbi:polynucleotide 5'-hydroxyl-kinase NOL9-like [Teleopsis dalmanni]|uniref:polynucleotide 5'-hydroxyl-kinase NOL9-like n=1 Tax=Teleopsis dalmanni TaxID=139649 RepID=UPI0018CEC811|nr:polynucleotide 5'-hydroxyl-kinase NOL9-like [Teleopsis dalmanni]